jgi:hypothetical protein
MAHERLLRGLAQGHAAPVWCWVERDVDVALA